MCSSDLLQHRQVREYGGHRFVGVQPRAQVPHAEHDRQLWEYLVMAAHSLVNQPQPGDGPDLGLTPA